MATQSIRETDLYEPVKLVLESQGYEVKSEIGAADIMAVRGEEDPVIVELKTAFSLSLVHQAIERLAVTDQVYVAIPRNSGRPAWKALVRNKSLCRRLGLGLITVRMKDGFAEILCDPAPYAPRKSGVKKKRLLREFSRRVGDPNTGGSTRRKLMTAYRQDALRCLAYLGANDATKASIVRDGTNVERAREIMAADHYGWFENPERGIYALSPKGLAAVTEFAEEIARLTPADE